jgi:Yip1 domain
MPTDLSQEADMAAAPVVPASPAPAEAAPLSEGARIVNTFFAPSKTFTDLRNAKWWSWVVPWLLIAVSSVVFIWSMGKQVGFEQVTKNQIAHSSRAEQFDKLPADQQARQTDISVKILKIFAYGSPALILFYFLIEAVALWVTFKVALGAETSFKSAYAIVMYAALPGIIGAILGVISMFAGVNPEGFDINNPVGTNLAYYLDPETTGKFVRGMASALDILIIWTIVLLGIGFASTSKVKRSTAIVVVAAWYLVYKLGISAVGAM